jgi:hypothetical protein
MWDANKYQFMATAYVAAERPTIVALLASMLICNLSLKNWYEAFAMAHCLP